MSTNKDKSRWKQDFLKGTFQRVLEAVFIEWHSDKMLAGSLTHG